MATVPKVLLLGDSIRKSYQPHVAELLAGRAEVVGPAANCAHSAVTLEWADRWIEELGRPDIVHWNNGIHDCGHNPKRTPVQIPLETYVANLTAILGRLRKVTPNVVWATMTPIHPSRPFSNDGWSWRTEEVDRYNAAARELMVKNSVPIDDLHAVVWPNVDEFLREDQIHLSDAGQQACAKAVAECLADFLPTE